MERRACWCCGSRYGAGCVIGPSCNCGWGECTGCQKCPSHCTCDANTLAQRAAHYDSIGAPDLAKRYMERAEAKRK